MTKRNCNLKSRNQTRHNKPQSSRPGRAGARPALRFPQWHVPRAAAAFAGLLRRCCWVPSRRVGSLITRYLARDAQGEEGRKAAGADGAADARSCANLLNSKVMNSSSLSDSWNAAEPKPTALSGCSPRRSRRRGERMAWGEGAHPVAHPWAPCGEEGRAFWVIFCPCSPRAARKTAHGTALPCTHHTWSWVRNGCSPTLAHPYPHPRASARHGVPRIAEPRNIRFL